MLLAAALLLGVRTAARAVPLAGPAFADLFTAHKWAARMIVRAIDRKLGGLPSDAARQSWTAPFSAA